VPRQAVYCHNPSPFYKPRLRQALWEPGFFLFCLGYRYLYRLNIHANERVIVQQDWIRQAFQQMFGLTNVVVAHPITQPKPTVAMHQRPENTQIRQDVDSAVFLYPALPRVFKNFEVVCEAAKNLYETGHHNFELRLTISGKESRYAAYIFQRYSHVPTIRFIGRQSQQAMAAQYEQATAVVFPSKLETWGLPISEAKAHGKPILLANLPYAHEALGTYDQAGFFNPDDAQELSRLMAREMSGKALYTNNLESPTAEPFAPDWDKLIQLLIAAPLAPDPRSRPCP
jgi:glycosyltransferase involved in cell wall biosynthesis